MITTSMPSTMLIAKHRPTISAALRVQGCVTGALSVQQRLVEEVEGRVGRHQGLRRVLPRASRR